VFLKGCPLRCLWCSNPESQKPWPELAHRDSICNRCMQCIEVCDFQAISIDEMGIHIDRRRCNVCGKCIEVCRPEALKFFGKEMSGEDVFQVIQKDIQYYQGSGGGITISGGDPLYQPEFTTALLKLCRARGIHTCIETSGHTETRYFEQILPYTSLVLFDLKHMNPIIHRKLTQVSNGMIIHNLELIIRKKLMVTVRVPIIPGLNDSSEEFKAMAGFIANLNRSIEVNLLPYHKFGMGKYQMLDRRYRLSQLMSPTDMELQKAKEIFESFKLICKITK
jgi:pyruvate formate lyase activating enzyme